MPLRRRARPPAVELDQRSVFDTVTASLEAYRAGTLMQVCLMHKPTSGIVTKLALYPGCCDLCDIVHLPTLPCHVMTKTTIWMQFADLLGHQLPSYVQDPTQPSAEFWRDVLAALNFVSTFCNNTCTLAL